MEKGRDWEANWVWSPGGQDFTDSYTYFRAEFELSSLPPEVVAYISADLRYRLWVNGNLIGDGPPPSYPDAVYYDSHEVVEHLRPGRNCVAVVVRHTGQEPNRRAGLLCEVVALRRVLLATGDGSWRCRRADAWESGTAQSPLNRFDPYQEIFDARLEPVGWRDVGFDDADWFPVELVGKVNRGLDNGQWASVIARPIPPMEEARLRPVEVDVEECLWLATRTRHDLSIGLSQAGRPLSAARVDGADRLVSGDGSVSLKCSDDHRADRTVDGVYDPCLLLDFGRQVTAFVELDVEGEAGAVVDIGLSERLVDGHFNNAIEGQFCARYILRGGRQRWRSAVWRGFRYLRLRANQTRGLRVHAVHAVRTRYPFVEPGQFHASDERLNQIFAICKETVRLCSHESIMDTPWREQAQWLGDVSAVTAPAIRTAFGDTALVEKFIRQSARTVVPEGTLANITNAAAKQGSRPGHDIPDYALWWVIDLLEHYNYTGDDQLVAEMFPVVRTIMDGIARQLTIHATLSSFGWTFIDWADVDKQGESAALTAIFYGALHAAVTLASVVQAGADTERWAGMAEKVRAAFSHRFWAGDLEAYVDSVHEDGRRSDRISEQTNFAAIRFGLVSGEPARSLAVRILEDGRVTEAQPFFTSVVLDALHRIGRTDLALTVIGDRWGKRMLDRGATSCFEEWGTNGSWRSGDYAGFMRTHSHAWSAHPATFLIKGLAGIDIVEPGCRRLSVQPYLGIDYRIAFPTPRGTVRVDVHAGTADVDTPTGIAVHTAPNVRVRPRLGHNRAGDRN